MFATFIQDDDARLIATAVHNGHELRDEVAAIMALDEATRRREEDPYTGEWASMFDMAVIAHHSRFEVDLNRDRENAVYLTSDEAWGLDLWKEEPSGAMVERSLALFDSFYSNLALTLDRMVSRHGGFVLYDIHSYNHRREGPDAPPEPQEANPTVNLGTGSMPAKWRPVAGIFLETMRDHTVEGEHIDARENVRFKGRGLATFVHNRYGDTGCALAIEFKKVFMDEWTDQLLADIHRQLGVALRDTCEPVETAWREIAGK